MIKALSSCTHMLQKLEIYTWPERRNVDEFEQIVSISRPLLSMRALVCLRMGALTLEAVEHLASLPSLESFTGCVRMFGTEQPSTILQFPSLKNATLGFHWTELPGFTIMLRCVVAPRLDTLEVEYFVPPGLSRAERPALPSASHLDELFTTLTKFKNLAMLDFELSQIGDYRYIWRDDACLSGAVLSRLFVLRNLRSLSMVRIPFDLHPHDIEAIVSAWPRIQYLRLGDMALGLKDRLESLLCVDDLRPIALNCAQLTTLGVALRIPAQYDQDPVPSPVESVCPLQWLHPGVQGVEFSIRDAAVLTNFFPDVRLDDFSEDIDQELEASRMTELIETMALMLKRQRQRLQRR
ncbi:hypothetical protein PsYK624_011500 [Phanerochaete sordida]|uniref:F-box domain-containing protein n=1 Tax=Phanerochaete sordida TaxID=48140 RepID=A0A9P3FYT1_9APHY|nr:hypothetical protein PsYK624_011500 [Phanerochaete sordida]